MFSVCVILALKYKWKRTNYLSKIDDWKTSEKENFTIALNVSNKKKRYALLKFKNQFGL